MQSEPAPADTIALPPLAGEGNGMGEARAVRGLSLSGPRHIPDRHDGALVGATSAASFTRGPSPYEWLKGGATVRADPKGTPPQPHPASAGEGATRPEKGAVGNGVGRRCSLRGCQTLK